MHHPEPVPTGAGVTNGQRRLIVVGGGILGTMHAVEAVRRGWEVIQLERDLMPRGASVRNFGLIWVSGRAPGHELEFGTEEHARGWESIASTAPGTGFRAHGSLTIARTSGELAVLEAAADRTDAEERGFHLLDPAETVRAHPAVVGTILGALRCERDAIVEPRLTLGALRAHLERSGAYRFLPGRIVVEAEAHAVVDHHGERYSGDLVICCVGADPGGFLANELESAPVRPVRLQMLETRPFTGELNTALADGDSLRYYPAFAGPALSGLQPQESVAEAWHAQLLLVRRLGGHLTIGDTHSYDEPFDFDIADEPTLHLLTVAQDLLAGTLPAVERRWSGVYAQVTDPTLIYYRAEVRPGVLLVTAPGGRGMTLSPAIAAETFE